MSYFLLVVVAKDGRRTDGMTGPPPGPVIIQPPTLSSKHFIFQLYLTPPSFIMFSSSSRVGMKLYSSIFHRFQYSPPSGHCIPISHQCILLQILRGRTMTDR